MSMTGFLLMGMIVTLTNRFGSVSVDTHGARVTSYVPRGGSEVFAKFADGTGGMPLCVPWFAALGPEGGRRHGLARYYDFRVEQTCESDDSSCLGLVWESGLATRGEYPHACRVEVMVRLGRTLGLTMTVSNVGTRPMPVTAAFHPYFRVGDATRCRVEGIAEGPVDVKPGPSCVYAFPTARRTYALVDPVLGRTLEFVSAGDADVAVWTPGPAPSAASKARTTSSFLPGEWRGFVAVENGRLRRESEVTVAPGESYTLLRTIRDTGAVPYGPTETALWQGKIDAASAAGGGTVVVPPGEHTVAQLKLKSGVTLRLEKGARLAASTDYADHPLLPGENRGAVVWAEDAERIAIEGEGEIDGRGGDMPLVKQIPGRWRGVELQRCRGVRIEGVTLRNAHSWCCYLRECEDVTVRKVKIVNRGNFNNDGLDLEVRNALVEDCDIDTIDDSIVLKNHNPKFVVENVEIRRCRVGGNTNSLKIGTETAGDFRNILIHDCVAAPRRNAEAWPFSEEVPGLDGTVPSGKGGIVLATVDGGTIDGVTVRDVTVEGAETPIYVRLGRRRGGDRESGLRNVLIENVKATAVSRIACAVPGVPGEPRRRPQNVVLRNIALDVPGGTAGDERLAEPVPECATGYPSPRNFYCHLLPACGVYVRHADGVKLENVAVTRRAPDCRPDVVRDDSP